MLPDFDNDGNLPPGLHWATWDEVFARFGYNQRRLDLLRGLLAALQSLKAAGCVNVYIDGSFVTSKALPGDFDGCWEIGNVDPTVLDPILLKFEPGRIAQKAKFGGELFPAEAPSGGGNLTFLEFFQVDKDTGNGKGIIALELRKLP